MQYASDGLQTDCGQSVGVVSEGEITSGHVLFTVSHLKSKLGVNCKDYLKPFLLENACETLCFV